MVEEIEGMAESDESLKMKNVEISQEVGCVSADKSSTSAPGSDSNSIEQKSNREERTLCERSRDVSVDDIDHFLLSTRLLALKEPKESSQSTEDSALIGARPSGLR